MVERQEATSPILLFSEDEDAENHSDQISRLSSQCEDVKYARKPMQSSTSLLKPTRLSPLYSPKRYNCSDSLFNRLLLISKKPMPNVFGGSFMGESETTSSSQDSFEFELNSVEARMRGCDLTTTPKRKEKKLPYSVERSRRIASLLRSQNTPRRSLGDDDEYIPRSERVRSKRLHISDEWDMDTENDTDLTPRRSLRKRRKIWDEEDDLPLSDIAADLLRNRIVPNKESDDEDDMPLIEVANQFLRTRVPEKAWDDEDDVPLRSILNELHSGRVVQRENIV